MKYIAYWSKPFKFCDSLDEEDALSLCQKHSTYHHTDQIRAFSFWLGRDALEDGDE